MALTLMDPTFGALPTNFTSTLPDEYALVVDDYASGGTVNTTDYIQGAHAAAANVFYSLTPTPADFDPSGVTLVRVRVHATTVHAGISAGTDNISVKVGLFSDNGLTALSNQVTLSEPTGEHYITLTMNSGLSKSQYDNAKLGVYQVYSASGCADATAYLIVNAVQLQVTWTKPAPTIISGSISDSGRNWTNNTQDVVVNFSRAVAGTGGSLNNLASRLKITVGGTTYDPSYVSGTNTDSWVVRIPILMAFGQAITVSYSGGDEFTLGSFYALDDGQYVPAVTSRVITNNLTRRIRCTLHSAAGTPITTQRYLIAIDRDYGVKYQIVGFRDITPSNGLIDIPIDLTSFETEGTPSALIDVTPGFEVFLLVWDLTETSPETVMARTVVV